MLRGRVFLFFDTLRRHIRTVVAGVPGVVTSEEDTVFGITPSINDTYYLISTEEVNTFEIADVVDESFGVSPSITKYYLVTAEELPI